VKILASSEVSAFVRSKGGRLWVWIDPHGGLGGVSYVYLVAAVESPGTSRATRRMRSSKLAHRFRSFDADDFEVLFSSGRYGTPDELHLELVRFPRKHVKAYWNGAVFVGDDIRPERAP
jgi:hypothetical protein